MEKPLVIIGGDAAGMSAASKAKREDPEKNVIVFEKGEWVSYGACGLPYYIKGEIEDIDELVSIPPEKFIEERDIDIRLKQEVTSINPNEETVTVKNSDEKYQQSYDKLLIATGASPIEPPFEGTKLRNVFTLRDMEEGKQIRQTIEKEFKDTNQTKRVGIIGGGYIGIEMAEAFSGRNFDVSLFEMLPHILSPFGEETAEYTEKHLRKNGINLYLDTKVNKIIGEKKAEGIDIVDETIPVDIVLIGVGVKPNVQIIKDTDIELGSTGAIKVDEYGRTNYKNIFAAGDCAEANNILTGNPDYVPLALTANRAGRSIGETMVGKPKKVGGIVGTAVLKAFDLEIARTGLIDSQRAEEAGYTMVKKTITTPSRPHYYPGGSDIKITMTADKNTGKLLGTSMVGKEGTAKRIDTVAASLHKDTSVPELEMFDLSYAPPFSPVWDPILTAAKVLNGEIE